MKHGYSNLQKIFFKNFKRLFFYLIDASCVVCEKKVFSASLCDNCNLFNSTSLCDNSFFSGFDYNSNAQKLIHTIKHEKSFQNLNLLKPLLSHPVQHPFFRKNQDTILIPVPLSAFRFQDRGFNQSEWLAYQLAKIYHLRTEMRGLIKKFETPPQSTLKAKDRRTNLSGAFAWNIKIPPPSSVCLIDDITTTGETLRACRKVLKDLGVNQIVSWTLFKVPS